VGWAPKTKQYLEHTSLISERKFAASHSGFWQDILPFSETFVRRSNLRSIQIAKPMTPNEEVERRSLVGELAFRVFCANIKGGRLSRKRIGTLDEKVISDTISYLLRFEDWSLEEAGPNPAELRESKELAQRLAEFFLRQSWIQGLVPRPALPGCGFLLACEGDVLVKNILVEVKTVERAFRIVDFSKS
jgi:hypothetical protein